MAYSLRYQGNHLEFFLTKKNRSEPAVRINWSALTLQARWNLRTCVTKEIIKDDTNPLYGVSCRKLLYHQTRYEELSCWVLYKRSSLLDDPPRPRDTMPKKNKCLLKLKKKRLSPPKEILRHPSEGFTPASHPKAIISAVAKIERYPTLK